MVPFINNPYVLFCSNMVTCHYTRSVIEYLESKNIDFIEKHNNAPNVPQARPIEKFWAMCKREYSVRKHPAKNLNSFGRIWTNISKKVAKKSGGTLMINLRQKILHIERKGVYESGKKILKNFRIF